MDIKDWINKKIPGDNFNSWNYDESLKIKELKKTGYPYSLACFNLNEDTIIAIGDADFDKSPSEIIIESKHQNFKLDASMHPKKTKTLYGFKTIFYVKKIRQTEKKNNKTKSSDKYYKDNKLIVQQDSITGAIAKGRVLEETGEEIFIIKVAEEGRYISPIDNLRGWKKAFIALSNEECTKMIDDLAVKKIFPIQGKLIAKDSTKQDKEKRIKQKTDALDKPMFYKNKPIYRHLKFTTNINKQDTYLNEIREQFIFNIFKIENKVFFAPEESFLAPLEYILALEYIYSKILSIRMYGGDVKQKDPYKFKNSDLGSVQITLDFLHNSPSYNCTIKTKGFRHDEIEDLFEYVWKNRHSNSNKDLR